MKILLRFVCGVCYLASAVCFAQVDIYQSDAYSVEEMCAREAEQEAIEDYTEYYESCIEQNHDNPLYQSDPQDSEDSHPSEEDY